MVGVVLISLSLLFVFTRNIHGKFGPPKCLQHKPLDVYLQDPLLEPMLDFQSQSKHSWVQERIIIATRVSDKKSIKIIP